MVGVNQSVPFNVPYFPENFSSQVVRVIQGGTTQGDGEISRESARLISDLSGGGKVLLTPSCTHALEMSTLLLDLKPGDEVLIPSFTFTSAAVALANYGVVPVFIDIDLQTKNIETSKLSEGLTPKTKAISVVNYSGVACNYPYLIEFARKHNLRIIEDNAHGLGGRAFGKPLGLFGHLSTLSFHESKNLQCGEGGALVINDPSLIERAEILREKGTNRSNFLRGSVDKYTWIDLGSSQLLSEISAAMLLPQLEVANAINSDRLESWTEIFNGISNWANSMGFELPFIPRDMKHTAHIFYVLAPNLVTRERFVKHLKGLGVPALFHYQPLHMSPAGIKFGRIGNKSLTNATQVSERLLRLPMYFRMDASIVRKIVAAVTSFKG